MSFSARGIWREFSHSKIGMTGIVILAALFLMSIIAFVTIPVEIFRHGMILQVGYCIQNLHNLLG